MSETWWHHPDGRWKFRLREWSCCRLIWQLLLSHKWPEREKWSPRCPLCGAVMKNVNPK